MPKGIYEHKKKLTAKHREAIRKAWKRPGRKEATKNRLGKTQKWILESLYNGKYLMTDGTAKIEKEDVYRDFYGLRNHEEKFFFHKHYDDRAMLLKARGGVWNNTHTTFVAMEKKGLIEKRWTFKGYYFVLADKGKAAWLGQVQKSMNKVERNG